MTEVGARRLPHVRWMVRNVAARLRGVKHRLTGYRRLKVRFLAKHGHPLRLDPPVTHSEKMQQRKLFDHNPAYPRMTDRIEARRVVDEVLGEGAADRYMVPLLAVADRFDDLNPALKDQDIIIKASHGCGWYQRVPAGSHSKWDAAKSGAQKWLRQVYGVRRYEWAYRDLRPRLTVEQLLMDAQGEGPVDIKLYFYHGVWRFVLCGDHRSEDVRWSLYNTDLTRHPLISTGYDPIDFVMPTAFEEMQAVASKLAAGYDMMRIDFLVLPDKWYLGELTVYNGSGMILIQPPGTDESYGKYWTPVVGRSDGPSP